MSASGLLSANTANDLPSTIEEAALLRQWECGVKCLEDKLRSKQMHMSSDSTVSEPHTLCLTHGKCSIKSAVFLPLSSVHYQPAMSDICSAQTIQCFISHEIMIVSYHKKTLRCNGNASRSSQASSIKDRFSIIWLNCTTSKNNIQTPHWVKKKHNFICHTTHLLPFITYP